MKPIDFFLLKLNVNNYSVYDIKSGFIEMSKIFQPANRYIEMTEGGDLWAKFNFSFLEEKCRNVQKKKSLWP